MNGNAQKLIKYMDGASKRFVIPVYQRNYDWKMEHCKQLYDDLVKVIRQNRKSHFFGSVVSVQSENGTMEEFLIIDGQQRLTTVSLLLLAVYHLLQKKIAASQDRQLADKILKKYLIDEYEPEEKRIKLKPIKNDQKAFGFLFEKDEEYIPDSNLTINYQYFYERIQRGELTVDELFDAICRLEIINISLNHEDNPQLIFESLNSTGLDLSEGDKIRNYILMGLETERQNKFYEKYWNRIEELTGYDVSAFIRDYLSVKQQSTPNINGIYTAFKRYVEDVAGNDVELLLKDLLGYAKRYEILLRANSADERLNGCVYRLNRLSTTVTRPFFLETLRLREENAITAEGLYEIFRTTENYIFRRMICDLPTNALNKIFLLLHREIIRMDGSENHYVEKFPILETRHANMHKAYFDYALKVDRFYHSKDYEKCYNAWHINCNTCFVILEFLRYIHAVLPFSPKSLTFSLEKIEKAKNSLSEADEKISREFFDQNIISAETEKVCYQILDCGLAGLYEIEELIQELKCNLYGIKYGKASKAVDNGNEDL